MGPVQRNGGWVQPKAKEPALQEAVLEGREQIEGREQVRGEGNGKGK